MDLAALEEEIAALEAQASSQSAVGGGGGKGKKNKKKKNKGGLNNNNNQQQQQKQRLEKKKTERQEALMEHYNELLNTLERKYDEYFAEDSDTYLLFQDKLTDLVTWYDNNIDKVNDDSVFDGKIQELDDLWDELFEIIKSEWEEANAELISEQLEEKRKREQAAKIAEFEAAGIKIGRSGNRQPQRRQLTKKQKQKKKLKEMKERLKQLDLEQKEKELEEEKKEKELKLHVLLMLLIRLP